VRRRFFATCRFNVKVFEQAPAFSRIGAGIILSANATKVLRRWAARTAPHGHTGATARRA
jgi:2-polyprenyl-6-methoxyphenol hydroxylase-like FAD-dependent oxidoreductase